MATVVNNNRGTRPQGTPTQAGPAARPAQRSTPNPQHPASHITVVPHPRKSPGGLRTLPGSQQPPQQRRSPLPMGQRGLRTTRAVKNLSVRSPMLAATLSASFAVSLLCFYVNAYARVNADGQHLSQLRQDLKLAQRREIELKSDISRYQLSATHRALQMKMIPAPPEMVEVLTDETGTKPPDGSPQKP